MQRTDLLDTSERAHQEMVRLLRSVTPAQRMQMVICATEAGREIHDVAMKRLAEDQLKRKLA